MSHTPMHRARPGWSNRYPALLWVRDFVGLAWIVACVLAIGFWASWTGQ